MLCADCREKIDHRRNSNKCTFCLVVDLWAFYGVRDWWDARVPDWLVKPFQRMFDYKIMKHYFRTGRTEWD